MSDLNILNTWQDKLQGSPIYPLSNGRLQTYVQIEGKKTDNGKVRFTSISQDKLLKKIANFISDVERGKYILKKDEKNKTVSCPAIVKKIIQDIQHDIMVNKYIKKSKAIERINILEKIIKVCESDREELYTTPMSMWTLRHCDRFRKQITSVASKSTAGVNIKYFNQLARVVAYAQVHYGLQNNVVNDYRQNTDIIRNGYFQVSRRERKLTLKILMSEWSIAKMRKFFNEIKDSDYIWYMLIYVLANTGVRRSELFGLRHKDFTFSHNGQSYLTICGQIDRNGLRVEFTKSEQSDYRTVPIGLGLAKKLKEYIDTMKMNPLIDNPEGIMFPMLNGFKIGSRTKNGTACYYKAPTGASRLADMMYGEYALPKGLAFHFFRSWIATQWAKYNVHTEFNIARYLGHTDMNTTKDSYIHVNDGAIEKINIDDFKDNLLF